MQIKLLSEGVLYRNPSPGLKAECAYLPNVVPLSETEVICFYRIGSAFYSADGRLAKLRSADGGWDYTASGVFRRHVECTGRSTDALVENPTNGNNKYHRHWFRVRVERQGNTLRHYVDDTLLNEYTDPDPIPAGRVALWTFGTDAAP